MRSKTKPCGQSHLPGLPLSMAPAAIGREQFPNTMKAEMIVPSVKSQSFNVKLDFNTSTRLASQISKALVRTGMRYFVEIAQEDYDEEYAVNEILQAATLVKHAGELNRNANRRLNPLSGL